MKSVFESVIHRGGYDLGGLLKKIDSYHIEGKLTDGEKEELYRLARSHASASVDVPAKLQELEARVRKLEDPGEPGEDYPDYVPGKWYYAGDKITYGGTHYVCVAPDGVVCTWSPEEYPAYWDLAA